MISSISWLTDRVVIKTNLFRVFLFFFFLSFLLFFCEVNIANEVTLHYQQLKFDKYFIILWLISQHESLRHRKYFVSVQPFLDQIKSFVSALPLVPPRSS